MAIKLTGVSGALRFFGASVLIYQPKHRETTKTKVIFNANIRINLNFTIITQNTAHYIDNEVLYNTSRSLL